MIGLSLSLCIQDIMSGAVAESDVTKIIAGTCLRTEEDWSRLFDSYTQIYWRAFEKPAAIELVQRLRAQGKIEQPRLVDPSFGHYINNGHWRPDEQPE